MNYLPLALAVGLFATPAFAGLPQGGAVGFCTGTSGVIGYSGVGGGGFICSQVPLHPLAPGFRAWIITGTDPDAVITLTIDNTPILGLNWQGIPIVRGQCSAFPAWTMPEYAEGYPIPEWPLVFMDQSDYDVVHKTVTIRIRALDALHGFEPGSNYSLNVACLPRPTGSAS